MKPNAPGELPGPAARAVGDLDFVTAAIESLPGIFYLYSYPELRLVLWNRNHETIFGYSRAEMPGKSITDWHRPETAGALRAAVDKAMSQGSNKIETPLLRKDGSEVPFLLTGNRFDSGGEEYLMGVGIDISERVAAEARLKSLNEDLERRVAERTGKLEAALAELRASQARLLVREKMAALGQLVAGLAHELNTPIGAILSSCETGAERVAGLKDALEFYRGLDAESARAFMRLYDSCAGNASRIGADDRSFRASSTVTLSGAGIGKASSVAERLSDAGYAGSPAELSELAVAHGFARLVDEVHALTAIGRISAIVRVAGEKAAGVVRALRAYSRHDEAPAIGESRIDEQIETILTLMRNDLKRGVVVVRRFSDSPPVRQDPELLGQVWMNLIGNAAQAIGYKGRIEIRVAPDADGRSVSVTVADDGPGIPEAVAERIFEPFFTTKAPGEGLGLGLDICRKILERMSGSISFASVPGRTEFTVRVPIDGREYA